MKLGQILASWRWANKLTLRAAGEQIGVSPATLQRLEKGEVVQGDSLVKVLQFLLETDDSPAPEEEQS